MARRIKLILKLLLAILAYVSGEQAIGAPHQELNWNTEAMYLGSCMEQVNQTFTRWRPTVGSEQCKVEEQEDFEDEKSVTWCVQTLSCTPETK
jgi:hypothetical protein